MALDFGLKFFCKINCITSKPRFFGLFAKPVLPLMNYFKNTLSFFVKIFLVFVIIDRILKMCPGEFIEGFFVFRHHLIEILLVFGHVMILSIRRNQIHWYLSLNIFFCMDTILKINRWRIQIPFQRKPKKSLTPSM